MASSYDWLAGLVLLSLPGYFGDSLLFSSCWSINCFTAFGSLTKLNIDTVADEELLSLPFASNTVQNFRHLLFFFCSIDVTVVVVWFSKFLQTLDSSCYASSFSCLQKKFQRFFLTTFRPSGKLIVLLLPLRHPWRYKDSSMQSLVVAATCGH